MNANTSTPSRKSSPVLTALLIALPLSLLGAVVVLLRTDSAGHALVAGGAGLLIGAVVYALNARGHGQEE